MRDWLDDLAEFPALAVAEAVKRWRQSPNGNKRPLPSDIRSTCVQLRNEHQRAASGSTDARPDELRNRRIQRLLAFRRWEPEWGAYPAQWEIDEVAVQRSKHELDATPMQKAFSPEQQAEVDMLKQRLGAAPKLRRISDATPPVIAEPFRLPPEDSPEVQKVMKGMGE